MGVWVRSSRYVIDIDKMGVWVGSGLMPSLLGDRRGMEQMQTLYLYIIMNIWCILSIDISQNSGLTTFSSRLTFYQSIHHQLIPAGMLRPSRPIQVGHNPVADVAVDQRAETALHTAAGTAAAPGVWRGANPKVTATAPGPRVGAAWRPGCRLRAPPELRLPVTWRAVIRTIIVTAETAETLETPETS